MAPLPHQQELLQGEVQSVLTRHLPLGMEGIGAAQTRAVMEVVSRRHAEGDRLTVAGDQREGMRMLRDLALGHRASSILSATQGTECTVCREFPNSEEGAPWPCSVWAVALTLGVVSESDVDFEVANDALLDLTVSPPRMEEPRSMRQRLFGGR